MFAGLSDAQMAVVQTGMARISVPAAQALFSQGDEAARFFILLEGRLKVYQINPAGKQIIVRIVHPYELCGFAPAMDRASYPGTAEAIVKTTLLAWPRSRWDAILTVAPSVAQCAITAVGRKLDEAHTRLHEMTSAEAGQRVASLLLRLIRDAGAVQGSAAQIPFPLTRQDIADMSGNTVHTVSRIMAGWEGRGILTRARRKVIVADLAALRAISANPE